MENKEILQFFLEQGLLVDKDILGLFSETKDIESVKRIIEGIKNQTQQKIITKETFSQNLEKVTRVFSSLPEDSRKSLEGLKIKLGLSIEISKAVVSSQPANREEKTTHLPEIEEAKIKVVSSSP